MQIERVLLSQNGITSQTPFRGPCVVLGRLLVWLATLLIALMPWTESLWHFDQFLRGGQDFEMGLLAVTAVLCLALVLLGHGRDNLLLLLALRRILISVVKPNPAPHAAMRRSPLPALGAPPFPGLTLRQYNLPIQV